MFKAAYLCQCSLMDIKTKLSTVAYMVHNRGGN